MNICMYVCMYGNAPSYLLELFILTSASSGRRSHRSASKGDFLVPRACTATRQKRAFSIMGLSVWNGLPSDLCSLPRDLSNSFYKLLKTLLFGQAWLGAPLSSYLEGALYKLIYR